jgi:hypothetical protein
MEKPEFAYEYFVSRRGTVATQAQEVADVLEAEGYKVLVQDYDAVLGGSFPLFIHDALTQAKHLIVLRTADYDTTHWTRQEFGNFLAAPSVAATFTLAIDAIPQAESMLAATPRSRH